MITVKEKVSDSRSEMTGLPILDDFAAIDFEAANGNITSACSIGIVFVRNREIVGSFYSLIKPTPNYYDFWTTKIHGIKKSDTDNAPIFPKVWKQVDGLIKGLALVAHGKSFEERCLKALFEHYKMRGKKFNIYCTHKASEIVFPDLENHKLQTVSAQCGYDLTKHHHALADAEACAHIALEVFRER
ncbi:MAG: 3'-5' exonuclease [Candidatus Limimorpha sp.]